MSLKVAAKEATAGHGGLRGWTQPEDTGCHPQPPHRRRRGGGLRAEGSSICVTRWTVFGFVLFCFKKTYLKQLAVVTTPQEYWSTCGAQIHTHLSLQLTSELDWHLPNQIVFI